MDFSKKLHDQYISGLFRDKETNRPLFRMRPIRQFLWDTTRLDWIEPRLPTHFGDIMSDYKNYELAQQANAAAVLYKPVTLRQEIEGNIKHLEDQLTKKRELLKLLDENPAIERFMDLSRS